MSAAASRERSRSPVAGSAVARSCQAAWCTAEKSSAAARALAGGHPLPGPAQPHPPQQPRVPGLEPVAQGRSAPSPPRRRPHPPPRPRPRPGPGSRPPWRPGTGGQCRRWPRGSGRPAAGRRGPAPARRPRPARPPPRAVPAAPRPRCGAADSRRARPPAPGRRERAQRDHGEDEVGRPVSPSVIRVTSSAQQAGPPRRRTVPGRRTPANVVGHAGLSLEAQDVEQLDGLAGQRVRLNVVAQQTSPPAANDRPRASDPRAPWLRADRIRASRCRRRERRRPHSRVEQPTRAEQGQRQVSRIVPQ